MPKVSKKEKFAELRALRQAGKKSSETYQITEAEDIYEEVDDEKYKEIARARLEEDDFVVDDNGEGYADDGREEWDREPQQNYDTDSEDERVLRGPRKSKKPREDEQTKCDANDRDRDISDWFQGAAAKTRAQAKPKAVKTEADNDFMTGLLGDLDASLVLPLSNPARKRDRSAERRVEPALWPPRGARGPGFKKFKVQDEGLSSPQQEEHLVGDAGDDFLGPNLEEPAQQDSTTADVLMSDPAASSPTTKAVERKTKSQPEAVKARKDEDEDDEMMEVLHAGAITAPSVNLAASRPIKKLAKADASPSLASSSPARGAETAMDASLWNEISQRLPVMSNSPSEAFQAGKVDHMDAIEEDGSLNFFWIDYSEVNGSLFLFGKVRNKKTSKYVSCFVKVDNILRKLYFLPRSHRVRNGVETDEEVGMKEVYEEVDGLISSLKVSMHKIKACTRKYAFELPGIPKEASYLKCLYPYTNAALPMHQTGETFSHVFGTNTALFEQFVLWKNVMGPCWLRIRDADFGALKNASYCKLEVLVESPNKMISLLAGGEGMDAAPLTVMSIAMRTTYNAKDNKQEILALSCRIYENLSLADMTPADQLSCRIFSTIRPHRHAFPIGFERAARERKKGLIKTSRSESELLSFFLAQVDLVDPDVILGHQLEGVDYSILLNRLRERSVPQWSRLGRRKMKAWPPSLSKVGGSMFAERQVMSGRLLCDLANEAGKSLMLKCQSWSLSEMCSLYLAGNMRRQEMDSETYLDKWAGTASGLMDYVTHMETDTYLIAALAMSVQILALTKVLTNLAGNAWARTLTGTRAERNEYILLHEFHKHKYVCPDKQGWGAGTKKQGVTQAEEAGGGSKKKDSFEGGLVFEPVKGLYDKFVLVMDFNSLYPSIIQEFNICFTTVERTSARGSGDGQSEDAEPAVSEVPEVPLADQEQGILPRLIATLVERRRSVKALMQSSKATPEQLATWDIKQLALKLTANSMYGCLGYTRSRFYARPLAVLTTYKGREILRSTRELAESRSLQVIYGDTDSVMINTNVNSVAEALRVGEEFKRAVNKRYRLLTIDIDNVFRRILLQAKKKYAAISLVEKDGRFLEKMEVKGLDMKRREFCALSKEVAGRLLDEILSGDDAEQTVHRIHQYLRETAERMRKQAVPTQKYIIFTQLGKAPAEYPNPDSMPQVQVALRELARGKSVRKGDVISYIITAAACSSTSEPPAKRAHTPQDLVRPDSGLHPDVEWYVAKQILPPVERLCANISATSPAQLADCLGLDLRRYASIATNTHDPSTSAASLEIHPLESQIPDSLRFASCTRLTLRCRACKASSPFEGLLAHPPAHNRITPQGLICPVRTCNAVLSTLSVVAQVESAIRSQICCYYEAWLVCDDKACGRTTRQISVYGSRCLGERGLARDCLGRMRFVVGERALYTQLVYYASLFDVERARERLLGRKVDEVVETVGNEVDGERVLALVEQNRVRFGTVKAVVERYLDKCGRQWVAMDSLFAKLGFVAGA